MTAETAEEVNERKRESERKDGRKQARALSGTHAEIALESLLGQESLGRIVYKVVPPRRPRERAANDHCPNERKRRPAAGGSRDGPKVHEDARSSEPRPFVTIGRMDGAKDSWTRGPNSCNLKYLPLNLM